VKLAWVVAQDAVAVLALVLVAAQAAQVAVDLVAVLPGSKLCKFCRRCAYFDTLPTFV